MIAAEIAGLVHGRSNGQGTWTAKCPAHPDKTPSLAIREGRDGRTLLKCFAGCDTTAIMGALGLRVYDLFDGVDHAQSIVRSYQRQTATADDVERELQLELDRILADESKITGFPEVASLVRHRNGARAIIERRFDVRLKREQPLWSEIEPHCTDPAWRMCIDQALHVVAGRGDVGIETLRDTVADLPRMQERVIKIARYLQRSLAGGRAA